MIGVLIPAHDEAAHIGACLASVHRAARHPALLGEEVRVVVALDACSDGTAWQCRLAGVQTLDMDVHCVGVARGAAADHLLAQGARWLASTDADSQVPPDWLSGQLACQHDVFCGVVDLLAGSPDEHLLRSYLRRTERWGDGHGRIHGANLGVCAVAYAAAGGFAAMTCHEDVALVQRLHAQGARIHWGGSPCVMTSARRSGRAPEGFAAHLHALERRLEMDAGMLGSAA